MPSLSRSCAQDTDVGRLSSGPRSRGPSLNMSAASLAVPKRRFSKQDFYRYCRLVHGWLSAFAFLILCLFSVTGLLLNHPDWPITKAPQAIEEKFTLTQAELERLGNAEEPERELVAIAAEKVPLRGAISG